MANRDTSRNSSLVDINGVPCSDLGDLGKDRRELDRENLNFEPSPITPSLRQKTNLCIDLLWWLNIEVINIHCEKHFLLRCWCGSNWEKYNTVRTFREVSFLNTPQICSHADQKLRKQMSEWIFEMRTSFHRLRLWRMYFYWPYCQSGWSIFGSGSRACSQTLSIYRSGDLKIRTRMERTQYTPSP